MLEINKSVGSDGIYSCFLRKTLESIGIVNHKIGAQLEHGNT